MMMKVCILTVVHSSFDVRIFHKEAKSLAKAGYDVVIIAQNNKEETVEGIKIIPLIIPLPKPKNRLERMFLLTLRCLIKALKQNANVYHLHDPELLPVGMLLKLITKAKVVYDVHEDYAKQILSKPYLPKFARKPVAWAIYILEILVPRVFDGVITATDDILTNFLNHKRAMTVKNFPVLSDFAKTGKNIRHSGDMFNLIYVGGITEIRGITQVIQALEFINSQKRVKLILYGKFYPQGYEKQIKSLKGFEKVEYPGWIRPHEIPEKMAQADVGIVCFLPEPNHINALPNKLFEYMVCGLPVIASNFPLWKEIVEGNGCGVCVNPLNPEEIAQAVEYLIDHPDEAKQMGENSRKAVKERYNWELMEGQLIKFYKDLGGAKDEKNQDR